MKLYHRSPPAGNGQITGFLLTDPGFLLTGQMFLLMGSVFLLMGSILMGSVFLLMGSAFTPGAGVYYSKVKDLVFDRP
ncbi:MAG: hypothetical protein IIY77_03285 [Lachnospiraceae bacterium]|nr:hypothetical protein [Lachnospiraceae bacterium]